MKKTVIASVAFAAALFAVSCQKETNPAQNVSGPMTISAVSEGLNTPTKTELAFKYDVLWSFTDKIHVVDGQDHNGTFKLEKGAGTTKGTFTQEGSTQFTGEVQAYYPATMLDGGSPVWPASQTNDQTIPMYCKKTLSGEAEERMDFSSLGSVLQIVFNTTQENVVLKSIEIKDGSATLSGAFTVDTDGKAVISATDKAGITLDLGTGVALGKAANYFNIAVPAGNYQDLTLVFTATDGKKCTMTKGKVNITYNAVGRLTLMGEKFKADVPAGTLPGVFTVDDNGTPEDTSDDVKVHFSKGNLTYSVTDTKWSFFEHQHYRADNGSASATLISLFTWGYSASTSLVYNGSAYVTDHTTEGDKLLVYDKASSKGGDDWGVAYCESNNITVGTWRTLSKDEWTYLFNNHSYKWALVNKVNGYVIAPDNVTLQEDKTSYTETELNDANLVFLPAAGRRLGSDVLAVGDNGYYWSSTARDGRDYAYTVYFLSLDVSPVSRGSRDYGYSVRLITESK